MQKIATLTGHTYRVLYLAVSPDGSTIVTNDVDPSANDTVEESEDLKVPTISTLSIGTDSKVVVEEKERTRSASRCARA